VKDPRVDVPTHAPYAFSVTTSILDEKEIARLLKQVEPAAPLPSVPDPDTKNISDKPVSLNELIDRFRGLLTAEEAEAMEHAIEENCERLDD
jgi:hypothetical protein